MSRKNTRTEKKKRRVIKALRQTPPAYIDLVEYVKVRGHCSSGMARKVILAGAVKSESHTLGFRWEEHPLTGENMKVLAPLVPAHLRNSIEIVVPKEVAS